MDKVLLFYISLCGVLAARATGLTSYICTSAAWAGSAGAFTLGCTDPQQMIQVTTASMAPKKPFSCPTHAPCVHNITYGVQIKCDHRKDCQYAFFSFSIPSGEVIRCVTVEFICVPGSCGKPPAVQDAKFTTSDSSFGVGAGVTYSCRDGFDLRDGSNLTCKKHEYETWLPHPNLLPTKAYLWSGAIPYCAISLDKCPRNSPSSVVVSFHRLCYEFMFENSTWEVANQRCTSRKGIVANIDNDHVARLFRLALYGLESKYQQAGTAFWIDHYLREKYIGCAHFIKTARKNFAHRWDGFVEIPCTGSKYYICEYGGLNATSCHSVPIPRNAEANTTNNLVNTTTEFICDKGYILSGSPVRQCLPSGLWGGEQTVCTRITVRETSSPGSNSLALPIGIGAAAVFIIASCIVFGILFGRRFGWCRKKSATQVEDNGINNPVYYSNRQAGGREASQSVLSGHSQPARAIKAADARRATYTPRDEPPYLALENGSIAGSIASQYVTPTPQQLEGSEYGSEASHPYERLAYAPGSVSSRGSDRARSGVRSDAGSVHGSEATRAGSVYGGLPVGSVMGSVSSRQFYTPSESDYGHNTSAPGRQSQSSRNGSISQRSNRY